MRRLLTVLAVLGTSCAPALSTPVASPQFAMYQYTVAVPTTPLTPNEPLHLVWEPRLIAGSVSGIADVQLCVALFGPWQTVEALKTAEVARGTRLACPPIGANTASETMRTTSSSGVRLASDVIVPSAVGFYDLYQISISSADGASSAAGGGGIIEVRSR